MAYIIGLVSLEEKQELERRGWNIEDAPVELIPKNSESVKDLVAHRTFMIMIWVDSSMFNVMSGPDWDKK